MPTTLDTQTQNYVTYKNLLGSIDATQSQLETQQAALKAQVDALYTTTSPSQMQVDQSQIPSIEQAIANTQQKLEGLTETA